MIKNYSNSDLDAFLERLTGYQRQWVWRALAMLREKFKESDHWTTGGVDKQYIDVRIGKKRLGDGRGNPWCYVWFQKGDVWLSLRLGSADKVESISCAKSLDPATLEDWFNRHAKRIDAKRLAGNGLNPASYSAAGESEEAEEPDEALVKSTETASIDIPLNQILFGPPGTGKTYETIEAALQIVDPELLQQTPAVPASDQAACSARRKELNERFKQRLKERRIRFVTFHQSFSYEDFVEGLRAYDDESGQIRYRVENGVFKQLCIDARHVEIRKRKSTIDIQDDATIWKISLGGAGSSPVKTYCYKSGQARIGWPKVGDMISMSESGKAYFETLGKNDRSTLHSFKNVIEAGHIVVSINSESSIEAVGVVTGEYFYDSSNKVANGAFPHVLPVDWLYKNIDLPVKEMNGDKAFGLKAVHALPRVKWPALRAALEKLGTTPAEDVVVNRAAASLPYVLIIDEINRGNVSRVFGELITLIEPSKREGPKRGETLEVILPYSKDRFTVPDNVYLIGTMNTADRSLAGLDIALRRRFAFKEMPPRPELLKTVTVGAINVGEVLDIMNQRITVLLDREHCIGHAYFMPLREPHANMLADLKRIFQQNVIPLLQEYFFEDWERIRWVLNDHAKEQQNPDWCFIVKGKGYGVPELFGSASLGNPRPVWCLNPDAFDREESYSGIVRAKPAVDEAAA